MKYDQEYDQYSKADFIKMLVRLYEIKPESAYRTWYKIRKSRVNTPKIKKKAEKPIRLNVVVQRFPSELKEEPGILKMLELKDMFRLMPEGSITRSKLIKYGFNHLHINYLIDKGYPIIDDVPK